MSDEGFRESFRKGAESAKIRSHWHGIGKGLLMGAGVAIAWNLPVAWYWKIAIYVAAMFVVGLIVQAFAVVRERRQAGM